MNRLATAVLLLLCGTAAGQATVPPGVLPSQRTIGTATAGLLRADIGYGGTPHAIRVLTPQGWVNISTPADHLPRNQSEDGGLQFCASGAIAATGQRWIVQQWQATALQGGDGVWRPQNSVLRHCDNVGVLGTAPWRSTWLLLDSALGESAAPPLMLEQTVSVTRNGLALKFDATLHRMSGIPEAPLGMRCAPYAVLNASELRSIIIDGVERPVAALPVGSIEAPPLTVSPVAVPEVTIACRCGRWLVIRGPSWSMVRLSARDAKTCIISCIVSGPPIVPGSPVQVSYEIEAQ